MTNRNWLKRATITAAALVLIAAMAFTACSKKEGGSGGSIGGGAKSVGKAAPASDFSYDLTEDKSGVLIKGYTGNGGRVVIPATIEDMPVKEIRSGAFRGGRDEESPNNRITEIVVPDSMVKIEGGAFQNMKNLTKATLPNGLKVIDSFLFSGCNKLTTVNLPTSLEEIATNAFSGCGELNNLIIPESISSVKFMDGFGEIAAKEMNWAFNLCGKLPLATRAKIEAWGYKDGF